MSPVRHYGFRYPEVGTEDLRRELLFDERVGHLIYGPGESRIPTPAIPAFLN